MLKRFPLFILLVSVSCSTPEKKSVDWKDQSRQLTDEYAESIGYLYPEYVADMGYSEFEPYTRPYSKDYDKERYALAWKWKNRLEKMLDQEKNEELRTDIKILHERVSLEMEEVEIARSEGIVPFIPLTEYIFLGLKDLIRKDSPQAKLNNAMSRFRLYVRGDEEQLPLADGITSWILSRTQYLAENRKRGFWPTRHEIETYLNDSEEYLKGIEELLSHWKGDEWRRDFEELKLQDANYREFIKKKILPYARKNNTTPYKVYAFILKDMGIKNSPNELIETAKHDYRVTYLQFTELAREIAADHKLEKNDPVSVIRFLQQKKITDSNQLLKLYEKVNSDLLKLVQEKDLLTIKSRPNLLIRFATPNEARSLPAPYFVNAPFFGKDKNRPDEFVITPADGGRDDFNFPEAVVTLTAHEAMPGHGLQYHAMRERGTTLMRALMAFNSVNVEGWGLYAEDLVYPYLTKEEKFVTLQRRLWRQARMFLDPELNLGIIGPKRVLDVYMNELGFSEPFAQSELRRFSYIMPGQANAYYYGYKKLMEMRARIKNIKCFNDAVLNMGVLPLDEISDRLQKVTCASL